MFREIIAPPRVPANENNMTRNMPTAFHTLDFGNDANSRRTKNTAKYARQPSVSPAAPPRCLCIEVVGIAPAKVVEMITTLARAGEAVNCGEGNS